MPYNLDIPGWMPEPELKLLERLARTIPPGGAMLEVGPFCGRSSWCWAKSVHPSVSVICVDIWDPVEHPYHPPAKTEPTAVIETDYGKATSVQRALGTKENFDFYTRDCPNIVAIRGRSPDDFRAVPENRFDLVFLDEKSSTVHSTSGCVRAQSSPHSIPPGFTRGYQCTTSRCKDLAVPFVVERRIWMIAKPPRHPLWEPETTRLAG